MVLFYGETPVLFIVFLLNLFAIPSNGWICTWLYSEFCLEVYESSPIIVLTLLFLATVFSLLATILQILCILKLTYRYLLPSRILSLCAALCGMASLFYYYAEFLIPVWSQKIALHVAGMISALSIYQIANFIYVKVANGRLPKE
ncbi:unnamed protein product [Rodentolepis nana]|uniref:Transmembrane protein n=1 Tax=Rodentolepis nana TaxID=102285 RepID=A0A0R3THV1_RODNA|nr:unnamed protein product [Rodentolepis nana]